MVNQLSIITAQWLKKALVANESLSPRPLHKRTKFLEIITNILIKPLSLFWILQIQEVYKNLPSRKNGRQLRNPFNLHKLQFLFHQNEGLIAVYCERCQQLFQYHRCPELVHCSSGNYRSRGTSKSYCRDHQTCANVYLSTELRLFPIDLAQLGSCQLACRCCPFVSYLQGRPSRCTPTLKKIRKILNPNKIGCIFIEWFHFKATRRNNILLFSYSLKIRLLNWNQIITAIIPKY